MKKYLISFADEKYKLKQNNLNNSALNYFDYIISYSPNDYTAEFRNENNKILTQNRGCGYWLWKSYFLLETFKIMNDDDILFYVDSGNTIINDINILTDYCSKDNKGIILFDNRDSNPYSNIWQNYEWTKFDCFNLMGCNTENYIYGNQVNASYQIYKKNKFTLKFLEENYLFSKNENIITDIPNVSGINYDGFRDHRHDQSILSLLSIKYDITIFRDPSEWGNNSIGNEYTNNFPQIFYHHR